MKAIILVEGDSDKNLIKQYCEKLQKDGTLSSEIDFDVQTVKGWTTLDSDGGESFRNMLKRNKEGKNLLIFDADQDPETRRAEILLWKNRYQMDFELFLFPNNTEPGAVETLLERIINPANKCVIECWHKYERLLEKQIIPWKSPQQPTCPSEKSKIYGYLEALVGTTKPEKEKIKDKNRNFTEVNHWDLEAEGIIPLRDFLVSNLQ